MKHMNTALCVLAIASAISTGALAQNNGQAAKHSAVKRSIECNAPSSSGHPHAMPSGDRNIVERQDSLVTPASSGHPSGMPLGQ